MLQVMQSTSRTGMIMSSLPNYWISERRRSGSVNKVMINKEDEETSVSAVTTSNKIKNRTSQRRRRPHASTVAKFTWSLMISAGPLKRTRQIGLRTTICLIGIHRSETQREAINPNKTLTKLSHEQ